MKRNTLQNLSIGITSIAPLISLGLASQVSAQALPGETLKFQQLPMGDLATNPNQQFPGHDELSTASLSTASGGFNGTFAADDFSDNVTSPIVDVQWWGSYIPDGGVQPQVQDFLVSFESNTFSSTGFSEPGQSLSSEVVTLSAGPLLSGSGTFTQTTVSPSLSGPDGQLYQYNAELRNPFPEQAGTTYWLKIVALAGPGENLQWGWHNRDYTVPDPYAAAPGDSIEGVNDSGQNVYHYLDDAVTGNVQYFAGVAPPQDLIETNMSPLSYSNNPSVDGFGASGLQAPSEDLAFSLYYNTTVPEPTCLPLLSVGMFLARRRRRPA